MGHTAGKKSPPPSAFTGHGKPDPSDSDIGAWVTGPEADRNIALRLPPGVLGLDVDAYGGKVGGGTLEKLVEAYGPLPDTWTTSARSDGVSGIRLFQVPLQLDGEPINWPGEAGPNIEIIQHGHRYALVWPSVNPDAAGAQYQWHPPADLLGTGAEDMIPARADMMWLPEAWVRGLALDRARVDKADLGRGELRAWWDRLRDGEPCPVVARTLRGAAASIAAVAGSRHESARDAAAALARYGGEGHAGAGRALAQLGSIVEAAIGTERTASGEWQRLLSGAVKLAAAAHPTPGTVCGCVPPDVTYTPSVSVDFSVPGEVPWSPATSPGALTLPEDFWTARPCLQRIRQAAHARVRSGDVVFYGVLVRLAAMAPHWLRVDTGIGTLGSLNLFAAIVGPSGTGKSSGLGVARDLYPSGGGVEEFPLGSGEGIAESYMGTAMVETGEMDRHGAPKKEKRREQVRRNVLLHADEGAALNKLLERSGSTVGETLRSGWSGEPLGQKNGREETTRLVHAGEYSLGLLIGYQVETVMPLLDDVAAGTPQRFLYGWAIDPSIPPRSERVAWPGVGRNPFPPDVPNTGPSEHPFTQPAGPNRTPLTFAESILAELYDDTVTRGRGEVTPDPYRSQHPMLKVKVSTLLAILDDGRRHVTVDDWALAQIVIETSDRVREYLIERARDAAAQAWARDTEALTARALHTHVAVRAHEETAEDRAVSKVAARLARAVHEAGGDLVHRAALRRRLAASERGRYDEAIGRARDLAWVVGDDASGWKAGPSLPA